ncbi:MAG: Maf family nucleotide pyrophosphatase [Bacteroidales bacterium]|nr:Maf family nucleotide pyrophosphatase [Bacteroidales bacterium]
MIDDLNKYRIILASRSPRRQQLLRELGLKFDVVVRDFNETYPDSLRAEEIAEYLSSIKAENFRGEISDNEIVITADTIVWCNGRVLGKPENHNDARNMIRQLSGVTHEVITGVTLFSLKKKNTFSESTKVTFEKLTNSEIDFYIEHYKPYDKAGAYGIQEWIGVAACSRIEGSYFNVVGLPVQKLYRELKEFLR